MRTSKFLLGLAALTALSACSSITNSGDFTVTPMNETIGKGCTVTFVAQNDGGSTTYTSQNTAAVTMSGNVATGVDLGTSTITAKASNGKTVTPTITVSAAKTPCTITPPPPTGITVKIVKLDNSVLPDPYKINLSSFVQLKAVVTGSTAGVTWNVTNGTGAVSIQGPNNQIIVQLKGDNAGTATLRATTVEGGVTATANLLVVTDGSGEGQTGSILVTPAEWTLKFGESKQFTATPMNITGPADVIWSSSNPAIASVNANGLVIAGNTAGDVTIKATLASNANISGQAIVHVTAVGGGTGVVIRPPDDGTGKPCLDWSTKPCGTVPAGQFFPLPETDSGLYDLSQQRGEQPGRVLYVKGEQVKIDLFYPAGTTRFELFYNETQSPAGDNLVDKAVPTDVPAGPGTYTFTWNSKDCKQSVPTYLIYRVWQGAAQTTSFVRIVCDSAGPEAPDTNQVFSPGTNDLVKGTVTFTLRNVSPLKDLVQDGQPPLSGPAALRGVYWFYQAYKTGDARVCDLTKAKLMGVSSAWPYRVDIDTTKIADGTYLYCAYSVDQIWNKTESTLVRQFTVDNSGPVVNPLAVTSSNRMTRTDLGWLGKGDITVKFSVSDPNGVRTIRLMYDGISITTNPSDLNCVKGTIPVTATFNTAGINDRADGVFTVIVEDCSGNQKTFTNPQHYGVDKVAPNLSYRSPQLAQQFNGGDPMPIGVTGIEESTIGSGIYEGHTYFAITNELNILVGQRYPTGPLSLPDITQWFEIPNLGDNKSGVMYNITNPGGGLPHRGLLTATLGNEIKAPYNHDRADALHPNGLSGRRGFTKLRTIMMDLAGNVGDTGEGDIFGGTGGLSHYVEVAYNPDCVSIPALPYRATVAGDPQASPLFALSPSGSEITAINMRTNQDVGVALPGGVSKGDRILMETFVRDMPNPGVPCMNVGLNEVIFWERSVIEKSNNVFDVIAHSRQPNAPYRAEADAQEFADALAVGAGDNNGNWTMGIKPVRFNP